MRGILSGLFQHVFSHSAYLKEKITNSVGTFVQFINAVYMSVSGPFRLS